MEAITSAIKMQTSDCCSISLNPYMAFQTWNHGKKKEKGRQFYCWLILLMSAVTNRSFYMRTLSLIERCFSFSFSFLRHL